METIFALATARGKAGVAVVRVSGPAAHDLCYRLCGTLVQERVVSLRVLRDPEDGQEIDQALVVQFAEGYSFTGEKTVEFHIHGSSSVQAKLLDVLAATGLARLAEPGEFTRRAMMNGNLDLAQVEGLADLIDAETEAQRVQSLRVMDGALGRIVADWREQLVRAAAYIAAAIDFSDEELPETVLAEVDAVTEGVIRGLQSQLSGATAAERIREGFEVAIVGPPNAGKSTLLNQLAGRPAALTSEIAGTTRDIIEVRMDIGGLAVILLDTAGLRDSDDVVEKLGVQRARDRAEGADLRIFLSSDGVLSDDAVDLYQDGDINVQSKADLGISGDGLAVSGVTGLGIDTLIARLQDTLEKRVAGASLVIRARHKQAMSRAVDALVLALSYVREGEELLDLAAEEYRSALRALDSLVGRVDVEDLLDQIFSSFCLGK